MKRISRTIAVLTLSALFSPSCLTARPDDPNVLALKGIKSLFVLVEELPPLAAQLGLTAEMIKNETESKLRRAGLSVSSFSYEDPYLYLRLSVVGEAFSVIVSLRDYVVLNRDRKITCAAATWLNSSTGIHRDDGNVLLEGLNALLDAFLNDLGQANPKK